MGKKTPIVVKAAMGITDAIENMVHKGVEIVDDGIGPFEAAGVRGVDKHERLSSENMDGDIVLDITEVTLTDEEGNDIKPIASETHERIKELLGVCEFAEIPIHVKKDRGCDPDACAEGGRRSCRGCNRGESFETDFLAKIKNVENDISLGRVLATYEVYDA